MPPHCEDQGERHGVAMRILLVRLGAFGDLIHTLPLLADLTAAGHEIHWLCEARWSVVLAGNPLISAIHGLSRRPSRHERRVMAKRLQAIAFDAAIDAQGLAKSARWLAASGAPLRLGFRPPRAREGAQLLANRRLPAVGIHVIDQQRSLARGLGLRPQGPPRFPLPPWPIERAWAAQWLTEQQLSWPIALNVGAGWPSKVWPLASQMAFVKLLSEAGWRVLIIWGSAAERQVAEQLAASQQQAVLAPPTGIAQLAALLGRCGVLVSGDTGPLHLAAALGCPTLGLFGPVPMERNGPRGAQHPNLQASAPLWERKRADLVDWSALSPERVAKLAQQLRRPGAAAASTQIPPRLGLGTGTGTGDA